MTHINNLKSTYYNLKTALLTIVFSFVSLISFANHSTSSSATDSSVIDTIHTSASSEATSHEGNDEEKFDINKTIMEHVADAHDWHLWGHTSIHLPVILYTDKGLDFFSSGKFNHGHDVYVGKYSYKMEHEKIHAVDESGNVLSDVKVLDFSITKNVATLLISVLGLILIFLTVANGYTKRGIGAPKGIQSWLEPIILFVRDDIASPNLGKHTNKYMPYLLTVFFFIWFNNMLGLIPFFPGGANVTGNIAVTMILSVITFVLTNINAKKAYWKHIFLPHVPLWLYPLMIPVEIIGIFTKPFALMIRLFANITAGHILVLSLVCLAILFKSFAVGFATTPLIVFISAIELLVAFLQAFIFTILSALFIGMAVNIESEEAHH
ncbi:MAG: F0F1 ATP synthase subunit A [Bacteroidia bacterium]|nr:F0F1 ATP synthase subunit A [Bacteroidia bacterium]